MSAIINGGAVVNGGGGGGASLPTTSTLALIASLASTVTTSGHDVVGYARIDPDSVASLTLEANGRVVSGVTGTLVLYDLDAAAAVATLMWTETAVTRKTASVTVPDAAHNYELRLSKSGGAESDFAVVGGANLLVTWS